MVWKEIISKQDYQNMIPRTAKIGYQGKIYQKCILRASYVSQLLAKNIS